jgi:hypothetical protein
MDNPLLRALSLLMDWVAERLRDLFQWPVNLVRDAPVRLARLLITLWAAVSGAAGLLRGDNESSDSIPHRIGAWAQRLLLALFDLAGWPEICQFVMHLLMPTSPLTASEIAEVGSVLGDRAIRWADVRVAQGGLLRLIFRYNGGRAFCTWHTIHLQEEGKHSRDDFSLLVHELTHVYQYENLGSRYMTEAIHAQIKMGQRCYDYGGGDGLEEALRLKRAYKTYNRESQAQIAQDFYRRRARQADVSMYEPYISELQGARF